MEPIQIKIDSEELAGKLGDFTSKMEQCEMDAINLRHHITLLHEAYNKLPSAVKALLRLAPLPELPGDMDT